MIRIDVGDRSLTVHLTGWDAALALKRGLEVPLSAVEQVRAAPWLIDARPTGIRLPGSYLPFWPGPIFAGSYLCNGRKWSFWALRRATADRLLELRIADEPGAGRYRTVVLQVDSPGDVAAPINRARALDVSA